MSTPIIMEVAWWRVMALALVVLSPGCIQNAPEEGDSDSAAPPTTPPPAAFRVTDNVTGCIDLPIAVSVDIAHAQSLLPAGYVAGDAGEFLRDALPPSTPIPQGVPPPTGAQGIVIFDAIHCESASLEDGGPTTLAQVVVYVDPPDLGEAYAAPGTMNLYLIDHYTSGAGRLALLAPIGVGTAATIEASYTPAPALPPWALGRVTDAEGELYAFEHGAMGGQPSTLSLRLIHQTDQGVLLWPLALTTAAQHVGPVTSCSLRAGSPAAHAVGTTECSPGQVILGVAHEDESWTGTVEWVPGLAAAPGA